MRCPRVRRALCAMRDVRLEHQKEASGDGSREMGPVLGVKGREDASMSSGTSSFPVAMH